MEILVIYIQINLIIDSSNVTCKKVMFSDVITIIDHINDRQSAR